MEETKSSKIIINEEVVIEQSQKATKNGRAQIDWSVVEQGCDCDWSLGDRRYCIRIGYVSHPHGVS